MHYLFQVVRLSLLFLSGLGLGFQQSEPTATPPAAIMPVPRPGQALQGTVPIVLNAPEEDIQSAELTFSYYNDPTGTWFLIYESDGPVSNGELTQWDTTTLTDGEYNLRLVLTLQDGNQINSEVPNLRVRNYTAIETATPDPTETPGPGDIPMPTDTPTATITPIPPTGTPLPPNPAQLTNRDIASYLGKGALGTLAVFAFIGLYTAVRNALRR